MRSKCIYCRAEPEIILGKPSHSCAKCDKKVWSKAIHRRFRNSYDAHYEVSLPYFIANKIANGEMVCEVCGKFHKKGEMTMIPDYRRMKL